MKMLDASTSLLIFVLILAVIMFVGFNLASIGSAIELKILEKYGELPASVFFIIAMILVFGATVGGLYGAVNILTLGR